jgi:hypothetical protein
MYAITIASVQKFASVVFAIYGCAYEQAAGYYAKMIFENIPHHPHW